MNEQITLVTKQQLVICSTLSYSSNALHNDIWLQNATKFKYISHRISSGSDSEVVLKVSNISEILVGKKKNI